MKRSFHFCLLLTLCAALAACSAATAAPSATTPNPAATGTLPPAAVTALAVTPTARPTSTLWPTAVPTETAASPATASAPTAAPTAAVTLADSIAATIKVDNTRLRSGPGLFFDPVTLLYHGNTVNVLRKARGDDWALVDAGAGRQGWLSIPTTSLAKDQVARLQIQEGIDAVVLTGRVVDENGQGMPGIQFAAFQGDPEDEHAETYATSMADGNFVFYLPPASKDEWRISLKSVACDSPIIGLNCAYTGAFAPTFVLFQVADQRLVGSAKLLFQYYKP